MRTGRLLACGMAAEVMTPMLLAELYDVSAAEFDPGHLRPLSCPEGSHS
jgi:ABC-type cobalamin transport system ATPase subunit